MRNANLVPRQPRQHLYHAYLVYMEAHGYKNTLSLTSFGKGLASMLKEYGLDYEKRRTNQGYKPISHLGKRATQTGYQNVIQISSNNKAC